MKRGVGVVVICFALILVLSLSVVSAFSLGDFFRKIFGGKEVQLSPGDSLNVLIVAGDACGKSQSIPSGYSGAGSFHILHPNVNTCTAGALGASYDGTSLNGGGWL